ncbi:hypothetical protein [Nannocystis sp. SCPEA4]|uniref:hypothetical protein n=1 Tax=Nannocystis sp. SCPEA4 TaxID=2996787 RepID=UPI00227006CD|nr:hypothetical protein [Nannocystis sp. SCPEA4]MCY1059256.1 hypothetical protein [Nannocystis sp. SCPEA4]
MNSSSFTARILSLWYALDRWLLLNRPRLWTMRLHHALGLGLAAALVAALVALAIPVSAANVPNLRPFFLSWLSLTAVASIAWIWLQSRALRHVSVRGPDGGGRTFALYLLCLGAINLAPLVSAPLLQQRIMVIHPEVAAEMRAFHDGLLVVGAYSRENERYRCQKSETFETRLCEAGPPAPASLLGEECTQWAAQETMWDQIPCDECDRVESRITALAPVMERYGCERAPVNLKHAAIAAGLGNEEAGFNRRYVFWAWLFAVTAAAVLTILRTTPGRVLVEVALGLGAVWFGFTFVQTAFGAVENWSYPLTLAVSAAGLLAAVVSLAIRPRGVLQRLVVAACLLAGVTTVASAEGMFRHDVGLATPLQVERMIESFSSPWIGSAGDPFFVAVLAAGAGAVGLLLALYRGPAQRLAARPVNR